MLATGLAAAVDSGLTKAVGVSNYSKAQMRETHRVLAEAGVPLAINQVRALPRGGSWWVFMTWRSQRMEWRNYHAAGSFVTAKLGWAGVASTRAHNAALTTGRFHGMLIVAPRGRWRCRCATRCRRTAACWMPARSWG